MNNLKIYIIIILSISYACAAIPTEVEINQEREDLRLRGEQLHIEKNDAITASSDLSTLSASYDVRELDLIKDIIENYRRGITCVNASQETKHNWVKKSLFNIAISSGLLTHGRTQLYSGYNSSSAGFENSNFFDDLKYLIKFRLSDENPRTVPLYDMTNAQAQELMDNPVMDIVWQTCDLERKAYDDQPTWLLPRDNHRAQYKDHRLFTSLYSFVAHQRERELLNKAIEAINRVNHMQFGAHLSIDQQTITKATFLKTLILIGEICTQKNLSPHTKQICPHMAGNDWQLLINIRNKLAHVEWDIHSRNLEVYLGAHDLSELQPSLNYVRAALGNVLDTLTNFSNIERVTHYNSAVAIPAMLPIGTLDPLRAFLLALPQRSNTYNADMASHSGSFDIISMITRIDNEEIPALRRIFNVTGREALEDDSPEDRSKLDGTNNVQMILGTLFILAIEKQVPQPLGTAFYTAVQRITAYHEVANSPLSLELPIDLFYNFPQLVGAGGVAELDLDPIQLKPKLNQRFQDYINAVIMYGRRCSLKRNLTLEPERVDAACYHFGRIGKFMVEIPVANLIPYMKADEYRSFRNFIQHGDDLMDIVSQKPHDFVIRYTHELLYEIIPNLKDLFLPQPVY